MSIIGKQLPEFTLDAFKKPELVKVSTADVLGKLGLYSYSIQQISHSCALLNWKTYKTPMQS